MHNIWINCSEPFNRERISQDILLGVYWIISNGQTDTIIALGCIMSIIRIPIDDVTPRPALVGIPNMPGYMNTYSFRTLRSLIRVIIAMKIKASIIAVRLRKIRKKKKEEYLVAGFRYYGMHLGTNAAAKAVGNLYLRLDIFDPPLCRDDS